jgi:hypothetical protein
MRVETDRPIICITDAPAEAPPFVLHDLDEPIVPLSPDNGIINPIVIGAIIVVTG